MTSTVHQLDLNNSNDMSPIIFLGEYLIVECALDCSWKVVNWIIFPEGQGYNFKLHILPS